MNSKKGITIKILSSAISLLLVLTMLSGCSLFGGVSGDDLSLDNLDGTSLAKLLLADQRLDSTRLDNNSIFSDGKTAFITLAQKAAKNRFTSGKSYRTVGSFTTEGGVATWSDFEEYNNSYSYFESTTSIITETAIKGAALIDEVKEIVSVVDVWVDSYGEKYYLSVYEDEELLCRVDDSEIFICKRYSDESGRVVYELYIEQELATERIKYIPGEHYELTQMIPSAEFELYFIADHSKGYWETVCITNGGGLYNESYTIMKNDVCYTVDYDVLSEQIAVLGIMSADTKTDILSLYTSDDALDLTLKFSGFDGITKATAPKKSVDENGNLTDPNAATVYFENGKTLKSGTDHIDGHVTVRSINMTSLADGYIGSCDLWIEGEDEDDRWNSLSEFIGVLGLSCRRVWSTVYSGAKAAAKDAEELVKYYQWNGKVISNPEGILNAVSIEADRLEKMKSIYTEIKDKPTLVRGSGSGEKDLSGFSFAKISSAASDNVTLTGKDISVGSLSLTVDDVRLLDENSTYTLTLAILSEDSGISISQARGEGTVYTGGDSFTVSTADLTFTLPELSCGIYTVTAFISTDDGIRVSEEIPLAFDSISDSNIESIGQHISVEKRSDDTLKIAYLAVTDHKVTLSSEGTLKYDEFLEMISTAVFVYGIPNGDTLERLTDQGYTAVKTTDDISSGSFRIAYTSNDGTTTTEAFVYIEYSVR